ncbi:chain-length determining protein [Bacteroides thetaiotaomicron]|uniref:chain-length determining protein n=1 Tax=Bacteroides thetaiotaomicron TaxID=818 RepID=UPI0039C2E399
MSEQQLNRNISSEQDKLLNDEMEIDLMDVLRKIISIRKTLYKAAGVGVIIGIIVYLSIPKQYTVNVTLSPEMGGSKSGNGLVGIAASFLGSGVSSGDSSDALNASLSRIVSSTPFLLELLSIDIPAPDGNGNMVLDTYLDDQSSPWWNYVIGFPNMLVGGVKSLFSEGTLDTLENVGRRGTLELSQEQNTKVNVLRNSVKASIDTKTAITNVSVSLQSPKVAAVVADSVVHKLQEYITDYRTSKVKDDCAYLEKLFKERQREYYTAQKKYANYVDTHDNLVLQSVRTEQERLQNDMSLAYQIYSQVANQLQVARAKVQEEKPVFAVVEPAIVPLNPSGMKLMIYVIVFVLFSITTTIVWKFLVKNILKIIITNV